MIAARRQKQAQKLQEQQISKALAESKPITTHVSFDDDDDDVIENAQKTAPVSSLSIVQTAVQAPHEGSDDDDAPIEVVSNKTSRKQASQDSARFKAQEKAERVKRQAAAEKRMEKQREKEAAKAATAPGKIEEGVASSINDDDEDGSSEDEASSSNRLDPSLFAEVFAQPVSSPRSILKKRSAEERADEVAKLQRERKQRRKAQRAGGVVRGRDGQPMKKLEDGTVLRALSASNKIHKTSFDDEEEDESAAPLDEAVRPTPLDPTISLPNSKARAFKKRSLLKKGTPSKNASIKASVKTKKDEDDPLGLNDPAFLPGGEFYHLMNKSDKAKGAKKGSRAAPVARQAFRGGGVRKDAVAVLRARSRGGPSLGFARSQEDSDDGC
ncbi:uncharacterized protein MEPE_01937 [Melanopsichium pennsylvanicum]|uniref:Uncharacterized protein n=2 Tax=Melanopsichium pennsylvanicum TaxID=63383 RepID=A0AAJ4XK13_9BASI|nr:hypothetical protein BN887_00418 [Melanopsichium pennsylvanicum 4]SNX83231.1 uncharacterized protein MEPE_01937 [Melanopsichium pennsylvanicum]